MKRQMISATLLHLGNASSSEGTIPIVAVDRTPKIEGNGYAKSYSVDIDRKQQSQDAGASPLLLGKSL